MTPTDRRAIALLARNGYAVVVPGRGFWLSGGERIAQVTVQRMVAAGYASRDPKRHRTRVLVTKKAKSVARPEDLPPEISDEIRYREAAAEARGAAPPEEWDYDIGWRAPDYRELDDRPVPLDRALREE